MFKPPLDFGPVQGWVFTFLVVLGASVADRFLKHAIRVIVWSLVVVCLIVLLVLWAVRHEPKFYAKVLRQYDTAALREAENELIERASAVVNSVERHGHWETVFTEAQLNAWLALDLPRQHPGILPQGISSPRIELDESRVRFACKYRSAKVNGILWLEAQVWLVEPNVLAVQLEKIRLGAVPLPMRKVLNEISELAARWNVRIEWRQIGGDPVVYIPLDRIKINNHPITVRAVRIAREGIYLAGHTSAVPEATTAPGG